MINQDSEKFRIQRHIEAVRNYLQFCAFELLRRGEEHDRSKLSEPELTTYCDVQPFLRAAKYGSEEYKSACKLLGPALTHHQANNRHHPEFFGRGVNDMDLIDVMEMLCDWVASAQRNPDSNVLNSIDICVERFKLDPMLHMILKNTAKWLLGMPVYHRADES